MTVLLALLALAPSLVAHLICAHRRIPAWTGRDITPALPWPTTVAAATLAAAALTTALAAQTDTAPSVAAAVGTLAFLAVLAVSTDLSSRKVPRDIPHVSAAAGLIYFAASPHRSGIALMSLAVSTVALVILPWIARALTRNGLGFSDIRLLWAFAANLSWWAGPGILLWALIGACLAQLVLRPLATPLRLARTVPVPGPDGAPTGRTRTEMPFAPVLCAAFLAAAVHAASTGASACSALGAC